MRSPIVRAELAAAIELDAIDELDAADRAAYLRRREWRIAKRCFADLVAGMREGRITRPSILFHHLQRTARRRAAPHVAAWAEHRAAERRF